MLIPGKMGNPGMRDIQPWPSRIASLRRRLEQSTGRTIRVESTVVTVIDQHQETYSEVRSSRGAIAAEQDAFVDGQVRQTEPIAASVPAICPPAPENGRVRQSLERGRDLLAKLRALSADRLLKLSDEDPLNRRFQQSVAMVEVALRTVQTFHAPGSQLHLCEGLEAMLDVVSERLQSMTSVLEQRRRWKDAHHRKKEGAPPLSIAHVGLGSAFSGVLRLISRRGS